MQAPPPASGELWLAAFELEPSGLAVLSGPELCVRVANVAFRGMVSGGGDPVGRTVEGVWPGEAGRRIRTIAAKVLTTGGAAMHERYSHVTDDGVERVFSFHVKRLPVVGEPAVLVAIWDTSDVEEARRSAERARERAELLAAMAGELSAGAELDAVFRTGLARASSLLGAADGVLWLVEPDGRRLRGFLEIVPLGRTGELLELSQHPHSRRAARALVPVLFSDREAEAAERALLRRAGAAAILATPLVERGRCTGLLHLEYREGGRWPRPDDVDFAEAIASQCSLAITRARVYESERLARARAEAAEAEARHIGELHERLAAVVGHDLRTPLAAVRLTVDALTRRGGLDAATRRAIARIGMSTDRMDAIIRDLLDFARARGGGGMPVSMSPLSFDEIARQAVQEAETAASRPVQFTVRGDCSVDGDASRLGQVVANLVGNALDHADDAEVSVVVDGTGDDVRLEVHNGGAPIPEEMLPHLFEPFRRGTRSRGEDARSGHLGLGLFIVAEIVRVHGGSVGVATERGAGTTFSVRLPRHPTRR